SELRDVRAVLLPEKADARRVGHVQCEYAGAAATQGADENRSPGARDIRIRDRNLAVHEVAVLIVRLRVAPEVREHGVRYERVDLLAGRGVECVEHAVVRADVHDWRAISDGAV